MADRSVPPPRFSGPRRRQIVLAFLAGEIPAGSVMRRHGIGPGEFRAWLREFAADVRAGLGTGTAEPEARGPDADSALEAAIRRDLESGNIFASHHPEVRGPGAATAARFAGAHCFWLITTGRSGTATLTRLLDHVPGIDAVHEPHPELYVEGRHAVEGEPLPREAMVRLLTIMRQHLVMNSAARGCAYAECTGLTGPLAGALRDAFAWSRFIHLVREPRRFVCSALGDGWYDPGTSQSLLWPRTPDSRWTRWQSLIWLWNAVHRHGLDLERRWGGFFVHRLFAEDLFRGFEAFEGLLRWMGVGDETAALFRGGTFQTLAASRNPARVRVEWNRSWDPFLEAVAGDTCRELFGSIPPAPGKRAQAPRARRRTPTAKRTR